MKKIKILLILFLFSSAIYAQGIISISPNSGNAGETISATIVLDSNATPPLPPANVSPVDVAIGSISATTYERTDNTTITASFELPSNTVSGNYDVTVTFGPPPKAKDDLVLTLSDGFQIVGIDSPTFFVDSANGNDANDGTSWLKAKRTIQAAIDEAESVGAGKVWVKVGTYYPTATSDRGVSIIVKQNVEIYGGFDGTETAISERDYVNNVTILSGDIGQVNDVSDNSYHVLITKANARIDGFSITGGNANGEHLKRMGGAIYLADNKAFIENNEIYNNHAEEGGAMYVFNINGDGSGTSHIVDITNCNFNNNSANNGGAVVLRVGASSDIVNCSFKNNIAKWRGGAIFIDYGAYDYAPIRIDSCTFESNSTTGNGGAIYSDDMASQLGGTNWFVTNCTFTSNTATYRGGAIANYNNNNFPTITNNTFTDNSAGSGGSAIANDYDVSLNVSDNTLNANQNIDLDDGCSCSGNDCP